MMNDWIDLSTEKPKQKEMVVFIAIDADIGSGRKYTTDPYCGWMDCDGNIARWPHNALAPTHFCRLPKR